LLGLWDVAIWKPSSKYLCVALFVKILLKQSKRNNVPEGVSCLVTEMTGRTQQ
jgi:hypothetical protein